jgi:DNA repair exonuclease SbcCD ATPase subunit
LSELLKSKEARMAAISRANALHVKAREGCVDEWRFAEFCARIVGRDGLPAHLCAVTAPALNQAAARYSEVFTEGEIGLTFNSDLNLEILNLHGGKTIKGQSAGELRMAAIIAALSFRDVLVSHNILVLDEPSEGLDPISAAAFARGMNGVVERFQHVLVISHSGPLLAELEPDHRITVTKENGVSSIVSS